MQIPKYNNIFEYINKLRNRLYVLIALPIIVFGFLYLEFSRGLTGNRPESLNFDALTSAMLVAAFASSIFAAYYYFHQQIKNVRELPDRKQQLDAYFKISMVRYYIFLAGVVIVTLAYWLTYNTYFAAFFIGYMFLISLNNPNMYRVFRHLRLSKPAREKLISQEFEN